MSGCRCKICGRSLRGVYVRYGGQACSACASFFVRSLEREIKNYTCGNNNLCLAMPSQTGAQCQKCRFQKCIDIGMTCTAFVKYICKTEESYAEYIILAKKLNGLFITCTENPQLLLNHLVLGDTEILEKSKSIPESFHENFAYIQSWAKLFQTNQIEIKTIHILFYSIVCNIQFQWLSTADQDMIFEAQQKSIEQHLQKQAYKSKEMKRGFDKLTKFFQNQYYKYFALEKLENSEV
uniref:Nuclear receptor domain-containing protein n=1 Tax=Panagrolaimus davidi TaxID=227884 RepID=A0A914PSK6_9BILA